MATIQHDDGYIKFKSICEKAVAVPQDKIIDINYWRTMLWQEEFIGEYKDTHVGYGNISIRDKEDSFLISGTQTGKHTVLSETQYALVTAWNYEQNTVRYSGCIKPSAEALTHAAIYDLSPYYQAVIHAHDKDIWNHYKGILPTTSTGTEYGTTELAKEITALYATSNLAQKKIIIMEGHTDGIIIFGHSIVEAVRVLKMASRKML